MKRIIILIMLQVASLPMLFSQINTDIELQNIITRQTKALYDNNFHSWQTFWKQDEKATLRFVYNFANYEIKGWDSLSNLVKSTMAKEPRQKLNVAYKNFTSRINESLAYIDFDMIFHIEGKDTSTTYHSSVVLLKEKNDWKITSLLQIDTDNLQSTDSVNLENSLNALGYNLLAVKHYDRAIKVFKLNVKFFPGSWNVYDSLGEAYLESGNKPYAKENYAISVKLNPKNDHGKKVLDSLR